MVRQSLRTPPSDKAAHPAVTLYMRMAESVLSMPSATMNSWAGSATPNHTPPPGFIAPAANRRGFSISALPLPSGSMKV